MIKKISNLLLRIKKYFLIKFDINKVKIFDLYFFTNWKDRTFNMYFFNSYSSFYKNYLDKINAKFIFIDIGANQGLYSLLASKNNCCNQVFAFEPVEESFKLLKKNIALNDLEITPFKLGISSSIGTTKIFKTKNHSGKASLENKDNDENLSSEKIKLVNYEFLNQLIGKYNYDLHIKIDVEGHELVVIKEIIKLKKLLKIKSIYIEIDERWIDPEIVLKLLKNFKVFYKNGKGIHYDLLLEKNS